MKPISVGIISLAKAANHVDSLQVNILLSPELKGYVWIVLLIIGLLTISLSFFYYQFITLRSKAEADQFSWNKERLKLEKELLEKKKELSTNQLQFLDQEQQVKQAYEILVKLNQNEEDSLIVSELKQIERFLKSALRTKVRWEEFIYTYDQVHPGFLKSLKQKHPFLSRKEIRLAALITLNLSNKEIALISHVTTKTIEVARYRLRKKMGLKKHQSLLHYLTEIQNICWQKNLQALDKKKTVIKK